MDLLSFEKKSDIQLEANQVCLKSQQTGQLKIDQVSECDQTQSQKLIHITLKRFLERLHLLSAIAVCIARGLNDTPKIAYWHLGQVCNGKLAWLQS